MRSISLLCLARLPVLLLPAAVNNQTVNIKWINERNEPGTGIIISWSLNLSHTIFGQVDLVRARQCLHGMEDIQQGRVAVHEHRFKKPEEPFLLQDWADMLDISVGVQACRSEVFDSTVDGSNSDERRAGIEDDQGAFDLVVEHSTFGAIVMEPSSQGHECDHQGDL